MKLTNLTRDELNVLTSPNDLYNVIEKIAREDRKTILDSMINYNISPNAFDISLQLAINKKNTQIAVIDDLLNLKERAKIEIENRAKNLQIKK